MLVGQAVSMLNANLSKILLKGGRIIRSHDARRTWWVMSGRASLMSRFILRMTPMCSSLFRSEYLSSRGRPGRPTPCEAL